MSADLLQLENFIAGQFTAPLGGRYLDSVDPSTGSAWARLPDSGADDVDAAVNSALNAFPSWSAKSAVARSQILDAIANQIEQHLDELAELESRDQGKPVWLARAVDIPRAVHNFRFFASANLHHLETATYQAEFSAQNWTIRTPVGVCGLISPWNLPLYLLTFKLAPCLAAGNTAVCKPSELTSVTAWRLCQLMTDAGLPAGVVNMVFGRGATAGEALVLHPNVPAVSFTGSTLIGSRIQALTAPMVKKLSLELGGKNAALVFSDCDLPAAVETCVRSSFTNQGEICLCTSRIFVERSVYNEFLRQFLEETAKWKVGDRRDPATKLGAVVSAEHRQKILSYIESAPASGGRILCGQTLTDAAKLPPDLASGFFVLPTVIVGAEADSDGGLSDEAPCMRDEIFGPVTCIVPFDDEAEAIKRANSVKYGLCATLFSRDASRIMRVCRQLQVGTVWSNCWLVRDLNMPFGGCKQSGIGREGAHDSLEFYTEVKTVCLRF
ncbi:hypothetical protein BOX15_Mlig011506g2 [Macrostomum lignano]|uniref:Aldedh domain-containing protein n=2 Tax=Macrostomum lignano TaxID=282301 RepID=A0A1I8GZG5_9PLAT|nr:hypothetical protein BOX15_Mlig011506g2 [Macrostomum lignano]